MGRPARPNHDSFGAILKLLREKAGLSQRKLASRAGLAFQGISFLEKGLRQPSWATVRRLARVLGVSVVEFDALEGLRTRIVFLEALATAWETEIDRKRATAKAEHIPASWLRKRVWGWREEKAVLEAELEKLERIQVLPFSSRPRRSSR